jgi:hypothetical protein
MDSQREPFMQGCMKKVPSADYCACGFEQFRAVFKDADLSHPIPDDDPRLVALRQGTIASCGSKLPEDQVKAGFTATCVGDNPAKAPYCTCAWPALRKSLAVADFLGDFQGPRFDAAKKIMAATCKGKFPAAVAKSSFVTDCTKGDASIAPACECLWKKLKGKYSNEEIISGLADLASVPGIDACKQH